MNRGQTLRSTEETKVIIVCERCSQRLRLPKRSRKLRVTCPTCRHEFDFQYYALGFSSNSKRPLLVGLVGSLVGFCVVEIIEFSQVLVPTSTFTLLLSAMLAIGAFATCLGAMLGAADGFFRKNRVRLLYGLGVGAALGLISGIISGLIAQSIFSAILDPVSAHNEPSIVRLIFARTIGWCVLGLLLGASHGIKENTLGDVKVGLLGGAIGGALGGLLFDALSSTIKIGEGTFGRLVAFSVLGMAISVAINRLQEVAISSNRPEMYRSLTRRLPTNPRLMLPSPESKRPPPTR